MSESLIETAEAPVEHCGIRFLALDAITHTAFISTQEVEGEIYQFSDLIGLCRREGKIREEFTTPIGILTGEMTSEEAQTELEKGYIKGWTQFFDDDSLWKKFISS